MRINKAPPDANHSGRLRQSVTRRRFLAEGAGALVAGTILRPGSALGAVAATSGGSGDRIPRVAFTWDNGFASLFRNGLPMFKEHRLPGTLYVTSGRMSNPDFPTSCTWGQIDGFAEAGWEISNHSRHHRDLRRVGWRAAEADMMQGKEDLVARGYSTAGYAYPYHQRTEELLRAVAEYHEYGRCGGAGLSVGLRRISDVGELVLLPSINMGHKTAGAMIDITRQVCFQGGRSLVWLCHQVQPIRMDGPGQTQSVEPAELYAYLRWVAVQQRGGRVRVRTCRDLVRENLMRS